MTTFYRLVCEKCSREHSIAQTAAGSQRLCECGAALKVPRLLKLKQLPIVEVTTPRARPEWNPARGYLFALGLVLLAIGAYLHLKIEPLRQQLDTAQPIFPESKDKIQDWPLEVAWDAWTTVRSWDLGYRATPRYLANRKRHRELTNYLYGGWGLAIVGGILMLVGLAMRKPQRK